MLPVGFTVEETVSWLSVHVRQDRHLWQMIVSKLESGRLVEHASPDSARHLMLVAQAGCMSPAAGGCSAAELARAAPTPLTFLQAR